MRPPAALLFFALLVLAANPASAAQPHVSFELPAQPVQPVTDVALGNLTLEVPCASLPEELGETIRLLVEDAPPWARVTVSPTAVVASRAACDGEVWRGNATIVVTTTVDGPALTDAVVRIAAEREDGTRGNNSRTFRSGFFSILDVVPQTTSSMGGPQSILTFPLRVANLGNGPTRVVFEVETLPGGWHAVAPPSIVVESRVTGARNDMTVNILVQTPGGRYVHEVAQVAVTYTSSYVRDTALVGDAGSVSLTATAQGSDIPAPAALLAVAAVLAAGAWRRR